VTTPIATPRYSLIAQRLIEEIAKGTYPVGSLLPREPDLCDRFGVARNTVRQAISVLNDMGLVSAKRGVGTLVRAKSATPKYVHSTDSITSLMAYSHETELHVLSSREVRARGAVCELLRCPAGQPWLEIQGARFQRKGGLPVSSSHVYVPLLFAGMVAHMDGLVGPTYALLEKHFGQRVVEVEQSATVGGVPAAEAQVLKVKAGSPAQHVVRHYLGEDGGVLMASTTVYPAGRFTLSLTLRLVGKHGPGEP
jgi:DNA-binding GntR family transcriptional regulator